MSVLVIAAAGAAVVLGLLAASPVARDGWRELAPGLELGRFAAPGADPERDGITVLRIDPDRWELDLHCASETDAVRGRSARRWCEELGLVAAVNAGMFETDRRRHVGYLRKGEHVNNGGVNDYLSAVAFAPRRDGLPRFRIFDLDEKPLTDVVREYASVAQNLRLIKRPGENRWSPQGRRWSEVALAEDGRGRALLIASRVAYCMHELNELLLSLPLDIVCAQHLEGGPEAQMYLRHGDLVFEMVGSYESGFHESEANTVARPIPNVIGVRPRPEGKAAGGAAGE
jgi:hypothetical protein